MRSHIRWNLCKIIPGRSQGLTPPRNHNNVSCGPIVDGRLDRKSARTSINLQQNVLSTGVLSIYFVDYWDSKTLHFPCIARFSRFLYIICITGYNRVSYFSKSASTVFDEFHPSIDGNTRKRDYSRESSQVIFAPISILINPWLF